MCGITGLMNLNGEPVSPVILRKMTDAIAHRGPDGEGFYTNGCIGLGHRRLAVIDLSEAASQPMLTEDQRYVLTYNGEIYNFRELRSELETLSYRFRSNSDSEVVLHAYAEWGSECVKRFNGMFALAIWDRYEQKLFLARDRYGVKPLYYTFIGKTLLFGSEQRALLAHPNFRRDVDLEGLIEYFTFQNIFSERTLLKNVWLFPAGSRAIIEPGGTTQKIAIERYWDYNFLEPENPAQESDYVEELDRLFRQAVSRQLVGDVEIGAYLSGGMDSSAITAIAASVKPYIKTFTCGFDLHSASGLELGSDERDNAELMSYLFKTEHYEMVLKAGDMERVMSKIANHLEEPRVGQSYPNYYAAQLASKFVKVVLSGTGGDELFGGYPWRYYRAVVNDSFEHYVDKYYQFWQRLIPNEAVQAVFAPIWNEVRHVSTRDIFRDVFHQYSHTLTRPEDYVNHSLYFEAKTFLQGLLIVEDKLSMAHGLESRVPFMDNDLVDFAMRVPASLKLKNLKTVVGLNENEPGPKTLKYFEKNRDGKLLFRSAMSSRLPAIVVNGVKRGFSAPDASWFKGESIDYVRRILFDFDARIYHYLDREAVLALVDEHLDGRQNRRLFIWSLLNVECWLKETFG